MNGLNEAFYFVTDKIIELQAFFIDEAWNIGRVVLLISVCTAAVNYALTGTGLKENIVKLLKAVVFFVVVMGAYPSIVSWITSYTFSIAQSSTYSGISTYIQSTTATVREHAEQMKADNEKGTYGATVVTTRENYFGPIIINRTFTSGSGKSFKYSTVAPAAALQAMLLVAGECMRGLDWEKETRQGIIPNIGLILICLLCAFFVIVIGCFALLEYLIAFMEFIFISSIGIICFPLSLWDGSKFMAEKFISALLGFFIKLLFCTICIFLMLYGFLSLARLYTQEPFMGLIDQVVMIVFTCLLFFYICKSAPALAQSLLTGAPSLNAAGAIGAAATAIGAVASAGGLGARAALATDSALSQAGGAASAAASTAKAGGGGLLRQSSAGAGAFMASMAGSGAEAIRSKGSDLTRSLLSRPLSGGHAGGVGGVHGGTNRFSATQRYLEANKDGKQKTLGEFSKENTEHGKELVDGAVHGTLGQAWNRANS
jgi:hypothetical protein